ncbi:DUF1194 domain-containing protein [Ovoidimarina sediminis]|uniref:DUF1194 domain-containing protein n=1 Tax=Ovoidimarina sediminis TaxID=3079856 RepID=UPI00290E9A39|nr:DUF1194 domain-containing protein [Rhodophyticola sp. MJ-SS7]MDU8943400.1 DUF1194 domain-containing protein [Rhodophyticola sp. MJ-SS7]
MRMLALILALIPGGAEAACRLALILALDVSGSVDPTEYTLQMGGIAEALEDAEVQNALLAIPQAPVSLMIFEWSGSGYQREVLGWTALSGPGEIAAVAARLRGWRRAAAPEATGLGAAMQHATGLFRTGPACWKRTLDVSGDGKNNDWPLPQAVRDSGALGDITVNALVVGQTPMIGDERQVEISELTAYFRANVLHGPAAFIEVALGFEAYAEAMKRKLIREVEAPRLGRRPAPPAVPEIRTSAPAPTDRTTKKAGSEEPA